VRYPWLPAFRIEDLDDRWATAPSTAGIYVISCGKPVRRAARNDPAGIIYVGQSSCIRERLWTYWYAQHEASGVLWDLPEVARALFGNHIRTTKEVDIVLGKSIVWVSTPIPQTRLDAAERAVLFSYTLLYGELPPLNSTLPGRWNTRPTASSLRWGKQALDAKRLTLRSGRGRRESS
jgi:hypothetical protein